MTARWSGSTIDDYNGRSMNDILNKARSMNDILNKAREAAEAKFSPERLLKAEEPSINIMHLGRELEAMEQRRQLQEQKEQALEKMKSQADRARARARVGAPPPQVDDILREIGRQFDTFDTKATPPPAPKKKNKITPPAPGTPLKRRIDWKGNYIL